MSENNHGPFLNTDRELWREPPGDYYANSVHVTEGGKLGINVGGMVFVKSLRNWHELANDSAAAEERGRRAGIEEAAKALAAKYEHPERQDHEPDACIMCHDLETILALLAPRDSGKGEHYNVPCLCGDGSVDPMRCPAHRPGGTVRK